MWRTSFHGKVMNESWSNCEREFFEASNISINKSNWIVSSHLFALILVTFLTHTLKLLLLRHGGGLVMKEVSSYEVLIHLLGFCKDRLQWQIWMSNEYAGWVQPLVTLVLCWASQSFALPPPRVLDPIVPRRTSSQAKGAQENQRKLRPEQKSKNEKYTWRTLWGNNKICWTHPVWAFALRQDWEKNKDLRSVSAFFNY